MADRRGGPLARKPGRLQQPDPASSSRRWKRIASGRWQRAMTPTSPPDAGPRRRSDLDRPEHDVLRPAVRVVRHDLHDRRPRRTRIGQRQRDDEGSSGAPVAISGSCHRSAGAHDDGLRAPGLQHDLDAPRRFAHVTADHQVARGDDLVGACRRGHGDVREGGIERRDGRGSLDIRARGRADRRNRGDRRSRFAARLVPDVATGHGHAHDRHQDKTPHGDSEPPRAASAGPAPTADRALEPCLS